MENKMFTELSNDELMSCDGGSGVVAGVWTAAKVVAVVGGTAAAGLVVGAGGVCLVVWALGKLGA